MVVKDKMKALLTNPIRTKQDFAAGGSRLPILTRNPTQSTVGFQTFGLPRDNVTKLGAYRMGDSDGNAPPSAIYPDEIFAPLPARDRVYPQRTFENVGNNVFQPEDKGASLHALLSAIGDQKFKAQENAPFADYFATQKLAKETEEALRNAGLEDLGYGREIMRNLVEKRRQQNEDDYLRRLVSAGMSVDDAQAEIDGVRRAAALQEAKKVDDREYQSKLLLTRIATSRGITPNVKQPLSSSSAIETPAPTQAMAAMMGDPTSSGFGGGSLDVAREFVTPDFYRRYLRKSRMTQEAADEMAAIGQLTAESGVDVPTLPQLQGMERQAAIERSRDVVAARLDASRNRGSRIMLPLPPIAEFMDSFVGRIYRLRGKTAGEQARFSVEVVQDLDAARLLIALNQVFAQNPTTIRVAQRELARRSIYERDESTPRRDVRDILRELVVALVGDESIRIPFAGDTFIADDRVIAKVLSDIKTLTRDDLRRDERVYGDYVEQFDAAFGGAGGGELPPAEEPDRPLTRQEILARLMGRGDAGGLIAAIGDNGGGVPEMVDMRERPGARRPIIAAAEPAGYPALPKGISTMKAGDWQTWARENGFQYSSVKDMKTRYENGTLLPL